MAKYHLKKLVMLVVSLVQHIYIYIYYIYIYIYICLIYIYIYLIYIYIYIYIFNIYIHINISAKEISVLERGLCFVPTPLHINEADLQQFSGIFLEN